MGTLCDVAKQDMREQEQQREAERAKQIIKNTPHAISAIQKCLGITLKPSDLNWNDEKEAYVGYGDTATFIIEGRKFFVWYAGYPGGPDWQVATYIKKPIQKVARVRKWFRTKEIYQWDEKDSVYQIRRPSDLIRAGICNG